jgi:hypothetical protein
MSQTGPKSAGTCSKANAFDYRHDASHFENQHHPSSSRKSCTYSGIRRWLDEKPFEEPWNAISRVKCPSGVYARKDAKL